MINNLYKNKATTITDAINTKRMGFIDIAKGIGIILVMFSHISGVGGETVGSINKYVASFFMPMFFIISGFLYKYKSQNEYFKSKINALFVPVVITYIYNGLIVENVFLLINKENYSFYFKSGGQWFVLALFYVVIIHYIFDSYVIKKANRKDLQYVILISLLITFFVLGYFYSKKFQGEERPFVSATIGYAFFIIGILLRKLYTRYEGDLKSKKHIRLYSSIIGIILLCATFLIQKKNVVVIMSIHIFGNPLIMLCTSVLGTMGILLISFAIKNNKFLEYFGKNSLIILLTHSNVYRLPAAVFGHLAINPIIAFVIVLAITVVLEYFIIRLINKYFPILSGKTKIKDNGVGVLS